MNPFLFEYFPWCSEDSSSIQPTGNTADRPERRTRHEERPPLVLLRQLSNPLKINHLSDWHAPERKKILVQHVTLFCRPALKCRRITTHC